MRRTTYLGLATLILLGAACLRLFQLAVYPPGPHYDEGAYLLITRAIAFGGARFFPIVEAYQGREVLYMYLNAPLLHAIGDQVLTLRLSSALINLATTAAAIAVGRLMFPGQRGVIIGLAAGTMLALSFPQFWLARQAFRAVTLPLMQALALALLWRGLRARHHWRRWLIAAGMFAGGAIYTYMASRLFPLWLAIGGLVLLLAGRRDWRRWLPRGLTFFGVITLVLLPMLVYALQKPEIFFGRLDEVTQSGASVSLWESIQLHVWMFFVEGDSYFRYNIPGRPYLTPPEGLFMLIGIAVGVRALLRRGTPPVERAAYALALLAPLMVIPSVISVGGLPPSHMRSLGMIPLLFILCAIGFEALLRRVAAPHWRIRLTSILIVGTLIIGVPLDWAIYQRWSASAEVYYETDADLNAAGQWLIEQAQSGALDDTAIYLGARDRGHPTVDTLPVPPLTYIGTDSLFRAPPGQDGLYVFPRSAPPLPDFAAWLEPGRIIDGLPLGPDGRTAFEAFRLPSDAPLPADDPLPDTVVRSPYVTLVGLHAPPTRAGGGVTVVMRWQIDAPLPTGDFTPLVELLDVEGSRLDRAEAYVTEADRWQVGSVLFQAVTLTPPITTPPGRYRLHVAWVLRGTDQYISYLDEADAQAGVWADIGELSVTAPLLPPNRAVTSIPVPIERVLTNGVTLVGADNLPSPLRPGAPLPITLYWRASPTTADRQLTAQLELIADDGRRVTLADRLGLLDRYPPDRWMDGAVLAERLRPLLPRDLPVGEYRLVVVANDERIPLGQVVIEGVARLFVSPSVERTIAADFGGQITLIGLSIAADADSEILTWVWQAQTAMTTDYTVFVHRLDADGQIIDQVDQMPLRNTYPTSLWEPGEIIVDSVAFPSNPAVSAYRVGWYDASNGDRIVVLRGYDPIGENAIMIDR